MSCKANTFIAEEIMTTIIERTPGRVVVSMSTRRWNRLQKLEKDFKKSEDAKQDKRYRHEALCGMFKSDSSQTELMEDYLREKYRL